MWNSGFVIGRIQPEYFSPNLKGLHIKKDEIAMFRQKTFSNMLSRNLKKKCIYFKGNDLTGCKAFQNQTMLFDTL